MSSSNSYDLFIEVPAGQHLEDDVVNLIEGSSDQQSLHSVSTFDLPSPALSSSGPTRKSGSKGKNKADKEGSWVWRWAEKRTDSSGQVRIFCIVKGCTQRNGYVLVGSSTSNIRNHLMHDHKLNEAVPLGNMQGPLESALSNLRKRNATEFSKEVLERAFCKVLVAHRLAYTFVESPSLLELLRIAQAAPTPEDIVLPSNDTIARR
ncbi:hypothetical protein KVV02_000129, partial [Mortierella alpina]